MAPERKIDEDHFVGAKKSFLHHFHGAKTIDEPAFLVGDLIQQQGGFGFIPSAHSGKVLDAVYVGEGKVKFFREGARERCFSAAAVADDRDSVHRLFRRRRRIHFIH